MHCRYCRTDLSETPLWTVRFILPLEPPSQNQVSHNGKDWRKRKEYQRFRDHYIELFIAAKAKHNIPEAKGLRYAIFTRLYSGRGQVRDYGNLVGGMKPLLDAMHHEDVRLLRDDSPDLVRDFYHQMPSNAGGVTIELEEF